jgi:hypothetical protein
MKPMTAAQYAAHSEKIKSQRPTEVVELKSGSVFELRRIDLKEMVQLGIMPQSLVAESIKARQQKSAYIPPDTAEATIASLELMREVVSRCCVMPPFNQETASNFILEDFHEIYGWAMSHQGVEGAEALTTFRQGRKRRASGSKSNGKELQPETVSTAAN